MYCRKPLMFWPSEGWGHRSVTLCPVYVVPRIKPKANSLPSELHPQAPLWMLIINYHQIPCIALDSWGHMTLFILLRDGPQCHELSYGAMKKKRPLGIYTELRLDSRSTPFLIPEPLRDRQVLPGRLFCTQASLLPSSWDPNAGLWHIYACELCVLSVRTDCEHLCLADSLHV